MIVVCDEKIRDCERILISLKNIKKAVIAGEKKARVYKTDRGFLYDEVGSLQSQLDDYYKISLT